MSASEDKKRLNRELQDIENEGIDWASSLGAIRDVMSSFNNLSNNNSSNNNPNNNISAAGLDLNKFTSSISSVFDKINNSSVSNMFGGVAKSGIVADTAIAAVAKKQENDVSTIYNKSIALPSGSADSSSNGSGVTNAITSLISSISSLNSALKDNSNKLIDNSKETARNTPLYSYSGKEPFSAQSTNIIIQQQGNIAQARPQQQIHDPEPPKPAPRSMSFGALPDTPEQKQIRENYKAWQDRQQQRIQETQTPPGFINATSAHSIQTTMSADISKILTGVSSSTAPYSYNRSTISNVIIPFPGGSGAGSGGSSSLGTGSGGPGSPSGGPAPPPPLPGPSNRKGFLGIASPYGGSAIYNTFESLKGFFSGVEHTGLSPSDFMNVPQQMRSGAEYSRLAHGTNARAEYNKETYLGSLNRALQYTSEQGTLHSEAYRAASERASLDMFGSVSGMTQPQIAAQNIALAQREHRARAGIIGTSQSSLYSLLEGYQHTDYKYSANTGFNMSGNTGIAGVMRRAFSSVDTKGEIVQEAIRSSKQYEHISINRDNEQTAVSDFSRTTASSTDTLIQKYNEPGVMNALRSYDEKKGIAPAESDRREKAFTKAKYYKNKGEALLSLARQEDTKFVNSYREAQGLGPVSEEHFENEYSRIQEELKAKGAANYADPAQTGGLKTAGNKLVTKGTEIGSKELKNISPKARKYMETFSDASAAVANEHDAVDTMSRVEERLKGSRATPYEHLKSMKGRIEETGGEAIAMNMQNMQWALMLGFSGPVFQALSQIPNESSYRAVTPTYGTAANLFGLNGLSRQFESFPEQSSRQLSEMQTRTNTMSTLLGSDLSARQAVNKALDISKEQPIQFNEALEIVSAMSTFPGTRKATANPDFQNKMFESAQFLAMLAPEQGTGGALFAMREMLGGQYRSLQTRFNISPDLLAGFANTSVGRMKQMTGEELIGTTHEALTSLFGGPKILMKRGAQMDVQLNNIGDVLTSSIVRPLAMNRGTEINKSLRAMMDDTNKDGSKPWIEKNSPIGSLESVLASQQVRSIKEAALIDTMDSFGVKYRKGDTLETAVNRVSSDKRDAFRDEYVHRARSSAENMYGTGVGNVALIATSISTMLGSMFGSIKVDDVFGAITGKVNKVTKDRIETYQQQTKDIPDDGSETSNNKRSNAAKDMIMGFISDIKKEIKSVGSGIGGSSFGNVISGVADLAREGSMAVLSPVANTIMTQTAKTALSLPSMMIGGMVDTATRGAYEGIAGTFRSASPQDKINPSEGMEAGFRTASGVANTAAWSSIMIAGSRPWAAAQRFLGFSAAGMAADKFENKDFGGAFVSLGQAAVISGGPWVAGKLFEGLKNPEPMSPTYGRLLKGTMATAGALGVIGAGYMGWNNGTEGFSPGSVSLMTGSTAMTFAPWAAPAIAQGFNSYSEAVAKVRTANEEQIRIAASGGATVRQAEPGKLAFMRQTMQQNPIIPISIGATIATAGITSGISNLKRAEASESGEAKGAYKTAGWAQMGGTVLAAGGITASGVSSVLGATALGTAAAVAAPALLVGGALAIGGGALYSYYADSEEKKYKDKGATEKVYEEIDRIKNINFSRTREERTGSISTHFEKTVKSFGLDKYIAPENLEQMRKAYVEEAGAQEDSRKAVYEKTINNVFDRSTTSQKISPAAAKARLFKAGQLDDVKPEEMQRKIAEKELSISTALTPLSEELAGMIQNPDSFFERDDRGQIKGKSTRRQQINPEKSKAIEERIDAILKGQTNLDSSQRAAVSKSFLEEATFAMRASITNKDTTSAMFSQNMAPMIASQIREQFNYSESMIPGLPNAIKGADTTEEFRDKTIQAYQQANQFENSALSKYEPALTAVALGGGSLDLFNTMGAAQKDVTMSLLKRGMVGSDILHNPQKINEMFTQVYMHGSDQDIKDFEQLLPLNIDKVSRDQARHAQVSNEMVSDTRNGHPLAFQKNAQGVWYDATATEAYISPEETKKRQERADDFSEKLKAGQIDTSVGDNSLISEIHNVYRHGTPEQKDLIKEKIPADIRERAGRTFGLAGYGNILETSSTTTTEQGAEQQPSGGQIPPPKKPGENTTSGSSATSPSEAAQETAPGVVKPPPVAADSTQGPGREIPGGVSISIGGGNNITIGGGNTISSGKEGGNNSTPGSNNTQSSGSTTPPSPSTQPDPTAPDPVAVAANEKEKSTTRKMAEYVVNALATIGPNEAMAGEMPKQREALLTQGDNIAQQSLKKDDYFSIAGTALSAVKTVITQQDIDNTKKKIDSKYAVDDRSENEKQAEIEGNAKQQILYGERLLKKGQSLANVTHVKDESVDFGFREVSSEDKAQAQKYIAEGKKHMTEGALSLLALSDKPVNLGVEEEELKKTESAAIKDSEKNKPVIRPQLSEGQIDYEGAVYKGLITTDENGVSKPFGSGALYDRKKDGTIANKPFWKGLIDEEGKASYGNTWSRKSLIELEGKGHILGEPNTVADNVFSKEPSSVSISRTHKASIDYNNGLKYTGGVNKEGTPEGSGQWSYKDQVIYKGLHKDGQITDTGSIQESEINGVAASDFINRMQQGVSSEKTINNKDKDTSLEPVPIVSEGEVDLKSAVFKGSYRQAGSLSTPIKGKMYRKKEDGSLEDAPFWEGVVNKDGFAYDPIYGDYFQNNVKVSDVLGKPSVVASALIQRNLEAQKQQIQKQAQKQNDQENEKQDAVTTAPEKQVDERAEALKDRDIEFNKSIQALPEEQKQEALNKKAQADKINRDNTNVLASVTIDSETGESFLSSQEYKAPEQKTGKDESSSKTTKEEKAYASIKNEKGDLTVLSGSASDIEKAGQEVEIRTADREFSKNLKGLDYDKQQKALTIADRVAEANKKFKSEELSSSITSTAEIDSKTGDSFLKFFDAGSGSNIKDEETSAYKAMHGASPVSNRDIASLIMSGVDAGYGFTKETLQGTRNITSRTDKEQTSELVPDDMFNQKGVINSSVPGSGFAGDSSFLSASGDIKDITQSLGLMPSDATNLQGGSMGSPIDVGALSTNASYVPSIPSVSDMAAGFGGVASISSETVSSAVSGSASPSGEGGGLSAVSSISIGSAGNITIMTG